MPRYLPGMLMHADRSRTPRIPPRLCGAEAVVYCDRMSGGCVEKTVVSCVIGSAGSGRGLFRVPLQNYVA